MIYDFAQLVKTAAASIAKMGMPALGLPVISKLAYFAVASVAIGVGYNFLNSNQIEGNQAESSVNIELSKKDILDMQVQVTALAKQAAAAPIVFTWKNDRSIGSQANMPDKPPSDELIEDAENFGKFIKVATKRRWPQIYGYAVNTYWPDPADELAKDNFPAIYINNYPRPGANGGFFWSESSLHIFIGGGYCLEAKSGGAIEVELCIQNKLEQMWWRSIRDGYTDSMAGFYNQVGFLFESARYTDMCISSPDVLGGSVPFLRQCKVDKPWLQVIHFPDEDVDMPLTSTETFVLSKDGSYMTDSADFSCSVAASYLANQKYSQSDFVNAWVDQCRRTEQPLSSAAAHALGNDAYSKIELRRSADGEDPFGSYPAEGEAYIDRIPTAPQAISRPLNNSMGLFTQNYQFGVPGLLPLQPGQWRCAVINSGQGNFVICDGVDWVRPVVIDAGTSTGDNIRTSVGYQNEGFSKYFKTYLERKRGYLKDEPADGLSTGAAESLVNSKSPTPGWHSQLRSPFFILTHGDMDHVNIAPTLFDASKAEYQRYISVNGPIYMLGGFSLADYDSKGGAGPKRVVKNWLDTQKRQSNTQFYIDVNLMNDGGRYMSVEGGSNMSNVHDLRSGNWLISWRNDNELMGVPRLYVLASNSKGRGGDKNANSLAVCITDGYNSFVSLGDVTVAGEKLAAERMRQLGVCKNPVVLMSHHGAETHYINTPAGLRQFDASAFLISAGRGNQFKHPRPKSVRAAVEDESVVDFGAQGVEVYVGQIKYKLPLKKAVFSTTHFGDIVMTMSPPLARKHKISPFVSDYDSVESLDSKMEFYFSGHSMEKGEGRDRAMMENFNNLRGHRFVPDSADAVNWKSWGYEAFIDCSSRVLAKYMEANSEVKSLPSEESQRYLKVFSLWNAGANVISSRVSRFNCDIR